MKNTRALKMFAVLLLLTAVSAYAAGDAATFATANASLTKVKDWLALVAPVVITLAIIFVGFRMAFQAAQWKDVAPVFWGGCLIGAATTIANMLLTP